MSMEVNSSYQPYAAEYAKQTQTANQTSQKEETNGNRSLLEKLQDKYSGFDISKGTFSQSQISSSKKGFQGVQISAAYLAKAENSEAEAKKLDEMLSGVEDAQKWLENAFARDGMELVSNGFYIDEQGNMGSWSVVKNKSDNMLDGLNEQAEKDADRIKEQREKKAKEKKEAEKKAEEEKEEKAEKNVGEKKEEKAEKFGKQQKITNQPVTVVASSNKKLLQKAKEALTGDETNILTEDEKKIGGRVDVSL